MPDLIVPYPELIKLDMIAKSDNLRLTVSKMDTKPNMKLEFWLIQ